MRVGEIPVFARFVHLLRCTGFITMFFFLEIKVIVCVATLIQKSDVLKMPPFSHKATTALSAVYSIEASPHRRTIGILCTPGAKTGEYKSFSIISGSHHIVASVTCTLAIFLAATTDPPARLSFGLQQHNICHRYKKLNA